MVKRILLLRTHYPHWGKHSGINRFIDYINHYEYCIDPEVVPMGDSNFPFKNKRICAHATWWVKKNGVKAYDLNDLMAEIAAFSKWLRGHVDILHYLDGEHSLQYLPFLIRKLGFCRRPPPVIANFHQPPAELDTLINTDIIRSLDHAIVLCPEQQTYFEQYLPINKITLIPHGIDTNYFQPAGQEKQESKFKCLTVGFWLRDYETILKVAKHLEAWSDIEFHIVSSHVKLSTEYKNVCLHQNIDDDSLLKLYQDSNVLFLPLLGATANNALLEGIACGLPVLSTQLPAIKTYVPGQEAILIGDNNPEIFTENLLNLYHHPERCRQMSQFARQRAMELSWAKIASQYEALYSQLLA